MRGITVHIARRKKPLAIAVFILFSILNGYSAFHSHPASHSHDACAVESIAGHAAGELTASQSDCNLCYYAATPRLLHAPVCAGLARTFAVAFITADSCIPAASVAYTHPLRGPPALSLS